MVSACHSPTLAVSKHVLLQIHDPNTRRVFLRRREWHAFTEATGPPNNRWTSKILSSFRFLELENEDQHTFSKTCPIFFWAKSYLLKDVSPDSQRELFLPRSWSLPWNSALGSSPGRSVFSVFTVFTGLWLKVFHQKKCLQMYPQKCEVWSVKWETNEIGNFSMKGPARTSTPMGSAALRCSRLSRPGRVRQLPVAAVGVRPKASTLAPRDVNFFGAEKCKKTWDLRLFNFRNVRAKIKTDASK